MAYIIHYDIAALIITTMIFIQFQLKKTIETRQNKSFAVLLYLAIISNITDIITIHTISYPGSVPKWFDIFINELYLITFSGTALVYCAYSIYVTKNGRMGLVDKIRLFVPFAVIIALICSSDVTRFIFYFDENRRYCHGKYFNLLYIVAIYYIISGLVRAIVFFKRMSKSQFATVLFFTVATLGAIVLQIKFPNLMIVQFVLALTLLLIFLTMENPENYIDKMMNTYNNMAFNEVFESMVKGEKKFTVLGIQIEGLKFVNENIGVTAGNQLMFEVAACLKDYAGRKNVFHLSGAKFAIVDRSASTDWDNIMALIEARFKRPFVYEEMDINLNCYRCMLTYPDTVTRLEDAIDMIDYSLYNAKMNGDYSVVYADKDILEKGKRENQVLAAVNNALKYNTLQVYYQPILDVKEGHFTTAEALVRLIDDDLGFVSPEEFIPIAEKNGKIIQIGEQVFRKVCEFYCVQHLDRIGIESIHFNLSVVECMQEKLYEKVVKIMDQYKLNRKRISLEITETAAVASKEMLKNNMAKLIEAGMSFSLDDYGTGFSNTATIITYPFKEIKIDKSIVWSSMENEKAMIALKHSVSMMKNLNMKIVAEGVETEEQAKNLIEMGCDYLQGYLYSKPLNEQEFLQKV